MSMSINLFNVSVIASPEPQPLDMEDGKSVWVRHLTITHDAEAVEITLFGATPESLALPKEINKWR